MCCPADRSRCWLKAAWVAFVLLVLGFLLPPIIFMSTFRPVILCFTSLDRGYSPGGGGYNPYNPGGSSGGGTSGSGTCSSCTRTANGWCADTGTCLPGSSSGPYSTLCLSWSWLDYQCPGSGRRLDDVVPETPSVLREGAHAVGRLASQEELAKELAAKDKASAQLKHGASRLTLSELYHGLQTLTLSDYKHGYHTFLNQTALVASRRYALEHAEELTTKPKGRALQYYGDDTYVIDQAANTIEIVLWIWFCVPGGLCFLFMLLGQLLGCCSGVCADPSGSAASVDQCKVASAGTMFGIAAFFGISYLIGQLGLGLIFAVSAGLFTDAFISAVEQAGFAGAGICSFGYGASAVCACVDNLNGLFIGFSVAGFANGVIGLFLVVAVIGAASSFCAKSEQLSSGRSGSYASGQSSVVSGHQMTPVMGTVAPPPNYAQGVSYGYAPGGKI